MSEKDLCPVHGDKLANEVHNKEPHTDLYM